MEDVERWLEQLGLAKYRQAFAENDIDFEVLPHLGEQELERLGVSLGHRIKLLRAIAAISADPPSPVSSSATAHPPRAHATAERRQLTVMFVDLVGSTALSGKLDPEDMGAVIRAYQACCTEAVERWSGHIAKYMGDGVLAYFGWPVAHEDDAERAIRAALELVAHVAGLALPGGERLKARVGIATGQVMVGDLIGEGSAQEAAVVGETPNLAARLQALATPGNVIISQATRRLLGSLFALSDLGPQRLKGFAAPLAAFRVEGEGRAEGRFEALHGGRLTPLVGRDHELAMLMERWSWAKDGEGQVVLVSGEAGIGKSRLLQALRQELRNEPHIALRHFCSPHHVNSALHPVITQLEHAAGFASDDPAEAKIAKLESLLPQASDQTEEALPLLAALLGLAAGKRHPAPNLSPQRQKQRTLEVLIGQLAGLARDRPVLELYEDLHWIDPSTLELLDLMVEQVRALPVLVVLTCRPEFAPPWSGRAHVTLLTINRLGRRQGAAIVERISGGKPVPAEVRDQILAKTDGVPLFVEELTKTVLESGLLVDAGDHYELTGPLPSLAIPATLHDSLMARLDRLAPVKEIAQMAAVIGREFRHDLLAALSPLPEPELDAALDQLVRSELIFRRGGTSQSTYSFKHALVQDAAYQSLLKSKRQQLHADVAAALRKALPELAEIEPEILAHHLTEAGLADEAISYWQKAGDRAVARSANKEAIAHFRRGMTLLAAQPASLDRVRREVTLQVALGAPLMASKGFAAPEVGEAYSRALDLCEQAGETSSLSPALQGLSGYHIVRAELRLARESAERCLALAEDSGDSALFVGAHHSLGSTLGLMGEPDAACDHLRQAIALYDPRAHHGVAFRYGADIDVFDRALCAHFLWLAGYPDQALATMEAAHALANDIAHPFSQALALSFAAMLHQFRREPRAARETARMAITRCEDGGFSYYRGWSTVIDGWTLAEEGQVGNGIARMQSGLSAMEVTGARVRRPYYLGLLAQAYNERGKVDEARARLAEARAFVETSGEGWWQAELHRLEGVLFLTDAGHGQAEARFHEALTTARDQQARILQLRAATSLSRLWCGQGKRQQAHDLLAPIYGWFTEGFDTADLKDAKALLEALR